jgi:hypothetical protein
VDVCVQMTEAVPAELEQQRSFLESLPTLPAPGTPEFEFSKDSFLQRYEMSEVLGEVRFTVFSVQLSAQPCTELLIVAARKCTSAGQPPNAGPKGLWRRAMRMWAILSLSCCICTTNAPALWLCCAIAPCSVSTPCRFTALVSTLDLQHKPQFLCFPDLRFLCRAPLDLCVAVWIPPLARHMQSK